MAALLELRRVWKRYGRREVIRNVDLTIADPVVLGVIGANGAGKTTLLRIMVGLVDPTRGTVSLSGWSGSAASRATAVGYFAGEATVPPRASPRRWMRAVGGPETWVADKADARPFRCWSRGQRQRAGLAALLDGAPRRLLVLDEPWEGLDPHASQWLSASLVAARAAGASLVVSSHRLHDLADLCDVFGVLAGGRLSLISRAILPVAATGRIEADSLLALMRQVEAGKAAVGDAGALSREP